MKIECNAFDVGASVNLFDLYDFINGVLCTTSVQAIVNFIVFLFYVVTYTSMIMIHKR